MSRVTGMVALAMCAGALIGCSTQEPAASPSTPAPVASASATPTPTPEPEPAPTEVVETSDPDLGIVLNENPGLTGAEAEVYNWVAAYETEFWRSLTTNTVSTGVSLMASPELEAGFESMVQANVAAGTHYTGTIRFTIDSIVVTDGTATASVCQDFSQVSSVHDDRTFTAEEAGIAQPQSRAMTLVGIPAESRWIVQTEAAGGPC